VLMSTACVSQSVLVVSFTATALVTAVCVLRKSEKFAAVICDNVERFSDENFRY